MVWNPLQSLKGFAASQPPLLMFTLCLMSFGLTMVVLAYLIGENEVPNPDVTMDWNRFLQKLTKLQLCIPSEYLKNVNNSHISKLESSHFAINRTDNSSMLRFVDESKSMNAVLSNVVDKVADSGIDNATVVNISVNVLLWIYSDINIMNSTPSVLHGSITGKQLGLMGKLSEQVLNVSFSFPSLSNISCEKWCHIVKHVCLTLHVSSVLLPHTRSPETCEPIESHMEESATVIFVEHDKILSNTVCKEGAQLHLEYVPDSRLTEMLTIHERSLVNLHLMHTSYFMFVVVMTLLCYALIKGRYRSPKSISVEKLPLDA